MAGALGSAALVYLLVNRALSAPRYTGQTTDHFDGRKFHNLEVPNAGGFSIFCVGNSPADVVSGTNGMTLSPARHRPCV